MSEEINKEDIPEMIKTLDEKIESLSVDKELSKLKVNAKLSGFGDIENTNDIPTLIRAFSMLRAKYNAYLDSCDAMEVDPKQYPFEHDGQTFDIWEKVIRRRLSIVKNQAELKECQAIRNSLYQFISEEEKKKEALKQAQERLAQLNSSKLIS